MSENHSESESAPLDAEDWEVVFQPYAAYPILAFILAQHLDFVKVLIQHSPEGKEAAITALDRAIESLMPHTVFRDTGGAVYLLAVAGKLRPDDEDTIREIGQKREIS